MDELSENDLLNLELSYPKNEDVEKLIAEIRCLRDALDQERYCAICGAELEDDE